MSAPRRQPRRPGWHLLGLVTIETGTLCLSDLADDVAGLTVSTWLGDGQYPVWARYARVPSGQFGVDSPSADVRVAEVRVIFDGSEAPR